MTRGTFAIAPILTMLTTLIFVAPAAASVVDRKPSTDMNLRLTRATEAGDLGEMRRLLALGADPSFAGTNAFRYPLLLVATIQGNARGVEILLQHGADPDATDLRRTPILVSAAALASQTSFRLNEAIRVLLVQGHADPNLADRAHIGDGRTALHLAAANGAEPVVEMLIAAGADPNVRNRVGETPLHFASARGHVETVRSLIAHGAQTNVRSRFTRFTPVMAAAESGHPSVVRLLIQRNADTRARNTFGDTPLTLAKTSRRRVRSPQLESRLSETIRLLELVDHES
jgi:uncharacterized protein